MNRRVLVDQIGKDGDLAPLGIVANLVYDRLLTTTDEAGLCDGDPRLVKGNCFVLMDDMSAGKISTAIDVLVSAELLHRGYWRGKVILLFPPESFNKYQKFRSDYRRRFEFGELSQVVHSQGLPGFRTATERNRAESARICASPTGTVTPAPAPSPSPAPSGSAASAAAGGHAAKAAGPPTSNGQATARLAWSSSDGWTGRTDELHAKLRPAYPACDLDRQFSAMDIWLRANPAKAVKRNWLRFASNWLGKAQERGGDAGVSARGSPDAPALSEAAFVAKFQRKEVNANADLD